MPDTTHEQLVTEIARDLVAQAAPQELFLFQETSEAYFKNPGKMLKGLSGKDEPLGFGLVEIGSAILMSPIVLAVVDEATKALAEEVTEAGFVKKLIRKLFHRSEERKNAPPQLTQEQMEQVRKQAFDSARQFNLPESQAALLADALIGRLALAR